MIILLRIQIHLKPYKLEQNNQIEILATIVGSITLFTSILFTEEIETIAWFNIIAVIILFSSNAYFLLQWSYLVLRSLKFKNKVLNKIVSLIAFVLMKNQDIEFKEENQSIHDSNQEEVHGEFKRPYKS